MKRRGGRNVEYKPPTFPFHAIIYRINAYRFWNYFKYNKYAELFFLLNILTMKICLMSGNGRFCCVLSWRWYSHSGAVKDKACDLLLERFQSARNRSNILGTKGKIPQRLGKAPVEANGSFAWISTEQRLWCLTQIYQSHTNLGLTCF